MCTIPPRAIPFSRCSLAAVAGAVVLPVASPVAVRAQVKVLEQNEQHLTLQNPSWTLWFNRERGWDIVRIEERTTGSDFRQGRFYSTGYRPKTVRIHDGGMSPEQTIQPNHEAEVSLEVEPREDGSLVTRRVWTATHGTFTETTAYHADEFRFDRRIVFRAAEPVAEIFIEARCTDRNKAHESYFLPENARFFASGPRMTGQLPFIEGVDPATKLGLGIQAVAGAPRTWRMAFGDPERGDDQHPIHAGRNYFGVGIYSPVLSYREPPYEHTIEFAGYLSLDGKRPIEVETPEIALVKAWPKKLVARPGEGNTLDIVIRNNTEQPRDIALKIVLEHGLQEEAILEASHFTLPPGSTEKSLPIDTRDLLFGVGVKTTLTEIETATAHIRKEFFTVWDGYYRVSPLMAIHNVGGARGVLAKSAAAERQGYVGVREIYNWPRNSVFDMTPETDWYLGGPYYFLAWSREYLKDYIAKCHEQGMGVVSWAQSMIDINDAMQYPQYLQYTKEGQFHSDRHKIFEDGASRTQGVLPPGPVENMAVSVNFGILEVSRGWGTEMAASCRMFGWDGVRFDGPAPRFVPGQVADPLKWKPGATGNYFDFHGNPLVHPPGPETDAKSLRNMSAWLEEARKGNPKFELGMNIGHGISAGDEPSADNRSSLNDWPESLAYAGRQQAMWLHEGALNVVHPDQNTWQKWSRKLMGLFRHTQKLGGVCTVGHIRTLPPSPDRARTYTAFAGGHRLAYVGSEEHSLFNHEKYHAAEFAIRFGEFLFAPDYELLPPDQDRVAVKGHERLLWEDFVRRRDLPGGVGEWVVHLVNLPENDLIARNDPFPPPREGTAVTLPLGAAEEVTDAWVLLPEPPRAVEATHRVEGEDVVVEVPRIDAFASVVVRTTQPDR